MLRALDLQILLDADHLGAQSFDGPVAGDRVGFERRQEVGFVGEVGLGCPDDTAADDACALRLVAGRRQPRGFGGPVIGLHRELRELGLQPVARFDHDPDLGLDRRNRRCRFVVAPLRGMHGIARRMLRAADVFEIGFDTPQIGRTRVERELRVVGIGCVLRGLRPGLVGAHQPQQLLPVAEPDLEVAILLRHDGLALEPLEIGRQLAQDVLDARQVLARVAESVLGLATPFLVLRDAGGLFEKDAQLVGPGLDDAADHALADDRVRARTEARAEEDVLDVAATHGLVVDQVGRRAVARQHALDRDLPVLTPRPRRLPAGRVRVVEDQFDARAARRLALAGAVEDYVLH